MNLRKQLLGVIDDAKRGSNRHVEEFVETLFNTPPGIQADGSYVERKVDGSRVGGPHAGRQSYWPSGTTWSVALMYRDESSVDEQWHVVADFRGSMGDAAYLDIPGFSFMLRSGRISRKVVDQG